MSDEKTKSTPPAATIAELKAEFKDDPAYALEAAEKGLTLIEAKAEYSDRLREQVKDRDAKLEANDLKIKELQADAEAPKKLHGAHPVAETDNNDGGGGGGAYDNPKAEVNQRIAAKMKADPNLARSAAHKAVMAEDPDLRQAYLEAHNAEHHRPMPVR